MANRFTFPPQALKNIGIASSLFDSTTLKAMSNVQESLRIISGSYADSFVGMQDSLKLHANPLTNIYKDLQESLSVRNLIDSNSLSILHGYQNQLGVGAEAIKNLYEPTSISNLIDPNIYENIQESLKISNASMLDTMQGYRDSLSLNITAQDVLQTAAPLIDITALDKIVIDHLDIGSLAKTMLKDLNVLPINIAVENREVEVRPIDNQLHKHDDIPLDGESLNEILEGIQDLKSYYLLSDRDKGVFLYVYDKYILPVLLNIFVAGLFFHIGALQYELQQRLQNANTITEVKRVVKSIGVSEKKELLKGYRVTIGDGLYLREDSNKKSDVILKLPVGQLLNVIDKSKRPWLYVEVEIEGELIEGWVARRYTTYFK